LVRVRLAVGRCQVRFLETYLGLTLIVLPVLHRLAHDDRGPGSSDTEDAAPSPLRGMMAASVETCRCRAAHEFRALEQGFQPRSFGAGSEWTPSSSVS
jgi:hypothetical protein